MQQYLDLLNEKQLEAVTTPSQHVRIIAGAGSGKTRVLTTRIAYLIEEWGIDPTSILAITFTNKAANEMKTRIENMLDGSSLGAHISTIHSFCVRFLRSEIRKENYPSNFTILDADDQKSIIKESYKILNLESKDYPIPKCLDFIANHKCAGFTPEDAMSKASNFYGENMAKIYKYYDDRCHQLFGLDFDDLLLWSNRILKKYPYVREKWQNMFHYILVDEFQDIDNVQYELINLLSNENTFLYVVGDPDQTIYTWRGADINIIMGFTKKYTDCKTIVLEENYRSTKTILNGANSLIKFNKNRVEKDLFTNNAVGEKIVHFTAADDDREGDYVVRRIKDIIGGGEYSYKDIAVLYRSSYLSRTIEKKLMDSRIPYVIFGGIRFYERAEVKDMLSYLRMITARDDLSCKRVINVPKRGIGSKTLDDLFELARDSHTSIFNSIDVFEGSTKTKNTLSNFKKMVETWIDKSVNMTLEQIFQMVFEESGYRDMLELSDDPKDEERLDNVKELMNDVVNFANSNPETKLEDYLSQVALYTDMQTSNNTDYVSLMTIHAAKGLEFDNVFVIGMSENIFPSARTLEEGVRGLEEERRLAYVAFTRAREHLYLSDNNGYSYSSAMTKQTSRFIKEIDEEYIQKIGMNLVAERTYKPEATGFTVSKTSKYKVGDIMIHDAFGEGVLIKLSDDGLYGDIAFPYPHQVKRVALSFPKLHKKEK